MKLKFSACEFKKLSIGQVDVLIVFMLAILHEFTAVHILRPLLNARPMVVLGRGSIDHGKTVFREKMRRNGRRTSMKGKLGEHMLGCPSRKNGGRRKKKFSCLFDIIEILYPAEVGCHLSERWLA